MRSNGLNRAFGNAVRNLLVAAAACAALAVASAAVAPAHASAQCTGSACTPVRPDGKGMIGLGLIGGEIGLIVPAIIQNAAHTNEWWPYLVFPLIGIGAGIGGGYGLEVATGGWGSGNANQPEIDIGIMVAGLVLVVPAIVGTLALASYSPPGESIDSGDEDITYESTTGSGDSVEAVQDGSGGGESSGDTSSGDTSSSSSTGPTCSLFGRTPREATLGGPGLLRFDADSRRVLLGVPVLGMMARYTQEELAALHLQQDYDVNVPVVSLSF